MAKKFKALKTNSINIKSSWQNISIHNIKILILGLLSYLLLFWLFPIYSFIGLYLLIGIIIGTLAKNQIEASILGLIVGIFSGIISSVFLTTDKFIYYAQTMQNQIVNKDIPLSLYSDVFYKLVAKNPIAYLGKPTYIFFTVLLICVFSVLLSIFSFKKIKIYIFLFVLCANFLFVSVDIGRGIADHASVEPPNYSYAYDAYFYLKTAYALDREPFYRAFITGVKYDGRISPEDLRKGTDIAAAHAAHAAKIVKNGQWAIGVNAMYFRQPFIFYVWKYIGQGNMGRVVYAGILLSTFLIAFSYFSTKKIIGDYAFIAPVIITPYLFTGNTWMNVFFPDWWTALFYLSGFLFWISEKYWPSALFFLFAVMSRGEATFPVYLIFFLFALFKKKEARKPLIIVSIFFAIWFGIHLYRADAYIYPATKPGFKFFLDRFKQSFFTTGASYMMFLYGFFKIPMIIFPLAAIFTSFIKKYYELLIVSSYYIFHVAYYSSSYWGQHFIMIILITMTFMFAISSEEIDSLKDRFKKFKLELK